MDHRGNYSRGYLPHRDYAGDLVALTFRLADSLPKSIVEKWRRELDRQCPDDAELVQQRLRQRIARYEDAGHGSCFLARPDAALCLQDTLIASHDMDYLLHAWCIMPNHVHVLVRLQERRPLGEILKTWKGASSRQINRMTNRRGRLWAKDFFDRSIRDEEHYFHSLRYIDFNPVKAGLCKSPEDWRFSSAGSGWKPEGGSSSPSDSD